ncbi:MAG: hypothetical protein KJ710_03535 [Candidatus Omnitrophica bacterium]|nr:hypothetical protein [Candidatus Omnitrophota bacterium]MBU1923323.1 hypothetical protein [Candidatus Omnitrophota bacterium]
MLKRLRIINIILFSLLTILLKAEPLSAEYLITPDSLLSNSQFQYANAQLWGYLRLGLTYLESPKPSSPPEAVPPTYVHPDSRGFGTYGLSPEAYEDVQRLYSSFKNYGWQDILCSPQLYELANQAFADLLLKHLQDYIPEDATQEQIFDIIHRAWNLGLTGFKNGRETILSRIRRAKEFKITWRINH